MAKEDFEDFDFEFLSPASVSALNYQQKVLYSKFRSELISWLRNEGKDPTQYIGYEESNIRPIARRIHQAFAYAWEAESLVLELTPEIADAFIDDLNQDHIRRNDGDTYSQASKRKFVNSLETYFDFAGVDWSSDVTFADGEPSFDSDPFNRRERGLLLDASFEYKSPPSYSNLSQEDRERWKIYLAQELGKPKEDITRDDWDELKHSWKIPALIATTLDAGWRAILVGRLKTTHLNLKDRQIDPDSETNHIVIPADVAAKNNKKWMVTLSDRSVKITNKWLRERENKSKYDDSDSLWLNRQSNPYNSKNLNNLLNGLMDEAGIQSGQRTLTWHSIRHSTGMYIYEKERDLGLVAELLRHKSLEAARKYAHPTPETKKDVIESIQGGAPLH